MADGIPECICGEGKMVLRCAGKSAMNAGRYYYKCPVNGKHPGSFLWSNEYHDKSKFGSSMKETGKSTLVHVGRHTGDNSQGNWSSGCSCCCGGKNRIVVAPQVLLCFMGPTVFRRKISIQCACTHGCNTPSAQKVQASTWGLRDMEFPSYFLLTAAKEIEEKEEVLFYEIELSNRVEALRNRYTTFKELMAQDGAYWDFPSKKVVAPEAAWERVCKKNPLAGAYFYHEEPHYYKLACLFGMYDIKMEEEKEMIIISESSEDKEDGEPSCYEIGSVCEEVTSPIVKPVVYARRKLFVTDEEAVDRESTTEPGIYFIEVAPDEKLLTRIEHGRVLPKAQSLKTPGVGPSKLASHASSCGSNSPIGWWPHIPK
ncbi:hypothetical protein AAHA92_06728 [Salvia divinorum]|uniref:GRF-type domain-containing protein n=1 Tax=Salvia divinorum TaxID=28513 RepID=A0ABD1I7M9_SALDI